MVRMWMALALLVAGSALGQAIVEFDAGAGRVTAPFVITNGYIFQPVQTDLAKAGRAVFSFSITNPGPYVILAKVDAPSGQTNAFYVSIDREPQDAAMLWEIPSTTGFTPRVVAWRGESPGLNRPFARKVFTLAAGNHELIVRGSTPNTRLAQITVARVPAPPGNPRVVARP